MKRWGPWTQGQLNKIRYDIQGYFRAYYRELRRLIAEYDKTADIPNWFRGGREITTSCCTDGVVIVHMPYDKESQSFPERADSHRFYVAAEHGRFVSVRELVDSHYSLRIPDIPNDRKVRVMPDYRPGEDFGNFVRLWPAYESYQAPDGNLLVVTTLWTRLEAASMSNLDTWRERKAARYEAWEALRPYVEGGELPVPPPSHR